MREKVINKARRQSTLSTGDRATTLASVSGSIQHAMQDIEKFGHTHEKTTCFVQTKDGKDAVVEPILSMWKINKHGQLT